MVSEAFGSVVHTVTDSLAFGLNNQISWKNNHLIVIKIDTIMMKRFSGAELYFVKKHEDGK